MNDMTVNKLIESLDAYVQRSKEDERAKDRWYDLARKGAVLVNDYRVFPRIMLTLACVVFYQASGLVETGAITESVFTTIVAGCSAIGGVYMWSGGRAKK